MSDTKNELETLLEKAATEPAHRPPFFSALLEATDSDCFLNSCIKKKGNEPIYIAVK